ncbi:MAG: ksgA [Rhodospirillales bacterium]|nr:ksgA [Rhodospirillales bacterium]
MTHSSKSGSETPAPSTPAALPPLREVIRRHGLSARKGLGQHFLLDLNLTRKIARAAGEIGAGTVIEVGPGPGGLTRALLLEGARRVIAIEADPRCLGALAEIGSAFPGRLEIIPGDALEVDAGVLGDPPRRIVSNLPYNVGTALLLNWLKSPGAFAGLTLMFQKEVADRLLARPGTKNYGRLTVLAQWLTEIRPLFDIPAAAFTPPPKVTSTVLQITPRARPLCRADRACLERVTAAAFGQRRKMLRQSLKSLSPSAGRLLKLAGVPETGRAEDIDIAGFCAIARALEGGGGEKAVR